MIAAGYDEHGLGSKAPTRLGPYDENLMQNQTSGEIIVFKAVSDEAVGVKDGKPRLIECQTVTITKDGKKLVNGKPQGKGEGEGDLFPVGTVVKLPGDRKIDRAAWAAVVPQHRRAKHDAPVGRGQNEDHRSRRLGDDRVLPEADEGDRHLDAGQ